MIPEWLAAALDTMPRQQRAIADGVATTDTYEAVARRVAVFEARPKGCLELATLNDTEDDWTALEDHVITCVLCKPPDSMQLWETAEHERAWNPDDSRS